jgi:selenide,water dikinase
MDEATLNAGEDRPRLTSLAHGAGCGCKLPAAELWELMAGLPGPRDPRVLTGSASSDDAALFALSEELALVQTVDFFTPIVDDPFDFGRIAAANALSDVYAMGGRPLTALNLVAFPLERLGRETLARILAGGYEVAAEAGCEIVGGHSIEDPEPKYGLAVTGTVDPRRALRNSSARAGDVLVLTKPLGAGALTTAHKRGACSDQHLEAAVATMVTLNDRAASQALAAGAHAATDVTGFGLLVHLHGLARESGVRAVLDADAVPALAGAEAALAAGTGVSGGARRNRELAGRFARFAERVGDERRWLMCDPMTSGGLLVALPDGRATEIDGTAIGRLEAGTPGSIEVG